MTSELSVFRPMTPIAAARRRAMNRRAEIQQTIERMSGPEGIRALILGPAGAGKSELAWAVARTLADRNAAGEPPPCELYEPDINAILTDTARVNEQTVRYLSLAQANAGAVLFIDSLARIFSADLGHIHAMRRLRDAVRTGRISFIATATPEEVAELKQLESQLLSNVHVIRLDPASEQDTLKILRCLSEEFSQAYDVRVSTGAMRAAVELTQQFLPAAALPGKAVEVFEKALFRYVRKRDRCREHRPWASDDESTARVGSKISFYDVKRVVEELASVDIGPDQAPEWADETARALLRRVYGQDLAVQRLAAALAGIRVRFGRSTRPAGRLLVAGPPGVGKLHAIKALAETVLTSDAGLLRFDMRQYQAPGDVQRLFGPVPANEGTNSGSSISGAIRDKSIAFLVFEHADAASRDAMAAFETIASRGYLYDAQGNKMPYTRAVLVFMCETREWAAPEGDSTAPLFDFAAKLLPRTLAELMDAVIPFSPLDPDARMRILTDRVRSFQRTILNPRVDLRIDKRVLATILENAAAAPDAARSICDGAEASLFAPIRAFLADHAAGECRSLIVTASERGMDIHAANGNERALHGAG